jgi:hypothetical protein
MCMRKYKFDAHESVSDFFLLTDVKEGITHKKIYKYPLVEGEQYSEWIDLL